MILRGEAVAVEGKQAIRSTWLFFSVALAILSGAAQLVVNGVGRFILATLCVAALSLLLFRLARDIAWAKSLRIRSERDALRSALHHVAASADAPFSERLTITFEVGDTAEKDIVHQEAVTTPQSALKYRAFYPVIPDRRETPQYA